jgi:crotonyl-CoA carboxylase/reductase
MAAPSQRIWGYETTWGSSRQFTKVQAQQLLPKPQALTWEEAASYGLVYFTAWRMLMTRCNLQAGQKVLIWGAAGGLGVFATQICKAAGRECVGVVNSDEKGELVKQLGAVGLHQPQRVRGDDAQGRRVARGGEGALQGVAPLRQGVEEILGAAPDIVFEHVGQATFPTSVLTGQAVRQGRHLRRHDGLQPRLRLSATCG